MTKKKLLAAALPLLAVLAAAAVLAPGLRSWYVGDDLLETGYAAGSSQPWAVWYSSYIGGMIFRPVTGTCYWYTLNYLDPIGQHLFDLALHGLNACLLFYLLRALLRRPDAKPEPAALLGALLFAVHPLGARTAAWIACRADLLGAGFSLAALLVAVSNRPVRRRLVLTAIFALLAMASKESQLPLGLAVAAVALARAEAGDWKRRGARALLAGAPAFAAAAIYLAWRLAVLGKLGSYELVESTLAGNLQSFAYHVPRMIAGAGRDFLCHHFGAEPALLTPLKAGLAALIVLALPAALRRERRTLLLGAGLALIFLLPVWNLSQMLAVREDRLFYASMVGVAVLVAAVISAPRHPVPRAASLAAALVICAAFALWSRQEVREWKQVGDANRRLARALAAYVQKGGPASTARRVYVLGLPPEHYYLDSLVKLELSGAFRDRLILTGDQAGFFWQPADAARGFAQPPKVPPEARPERQAHATLPGMVFETVTPPDLITAAELDPYARILEWNGRSLADRTQELKNLFYRRGLLRLRLDQEPVWLPSFGFRLNLIPFNWTLAPGLYRIEPDEMGKPYTFIAANHDPYLVSPPLQFSALAASKLTLTMTLPARTFVPPGQDQGCIMWTSNLYPRLDPRRTIYFPLRADGKEHEYIINLARNPYWPLSGDISSLRLDPIAYPASFQLVRMEFLPR
jgi:hypothetical protein